MVVVCIVRTISKAGSKGANDKLHKYRKKTSLLANIEFIGATVSEFRFFMRLKTQCNIGLKTSELKGEIIIQYTS